MVDRECLGAIPSCPEEGGPAAFTEQPLQQGGTVDTIAPPAPVAQALGLTVAPPAGQWVLYLLTGQQYRLRDTGGGPAGLSSFCYGALVFGPGAGTPDARIVSADSIMDGAVSAQLSVDAAGVVSATFSDPAPNTISARTIVQLSPPQILTAPPAPPPVP